MNKKTGKPYHHGNLAESLLNAVDELASQFGIEAVTLRACSRLIGVSPSSAFRHYPDKRSLLTAFATRALSQLSDALEQASTAAVEQKQDAFLAVGLAYVGFALEKPALFRAMWREETIYSQDADYLAAANHLSTKLKNGFANTIHDQDATELSTHELLAWSSLHGLANLYVDGPVENDKNTKEKMRTAAELIRALRPVLGTPSTDNKFT